MVSLYPKPSSVCSASPKFVDRALWRSFSNDLVVSSFFDESCYKDSKMHGPGTDFIYSSSSSVARLKLLKCLELSKVFGESVN